MSAEEVAPPAAAPFTLGQYVTALIDALGAAHPAALTRLRQVVGGHRARIVLDDEAIVVAFAPEGLRVQPAVDGEPVDGAGATDSATVLALLDDYLEVGAAILNDQIRVSGTPEAIVFMFTAIEILLDGSPRTPALQALAARFQSERAQRRQASASAPRPPWYPFAAEASEVDLLARLDLLPDASDLPER